MLSKADLHLHTHCGPDSFTTIGQLAGAALKRGVRVIAVTDHDSVQGGRLMKKYVKAKKLDLDVIIGQEISTLQGHLLGLFLHAKIAPHMTLKEAAREVKRQGGITIIPHISFSRAPGTGFPYRMRVHYQALLQDPDVLQYIDAIEVGTFCLFEPDYYAKAHFLNEKLLHKAEVASSDAHLFWHVGNAYTLFEGETAADLRQAILQRSTAVFSGIPHNIGDRVAYYASALKMPFAFLFYRVKAFLQAFFSIGKKYVFYPKFRQLKPRQVMQEIEKKYLELQE